MWKRGDHTTGAGAIACAIPPSVIGINRMRAIQRLDSANGVERPKSNAGTLRDQAIRQASSELNGTVRTEFLDVHMGNHAPFACEVESSLGI